MADAKSISKIQVPLETNITKFSKNLEKAKKDADKTSKEIASKFSLMGTGISDSIDKIGTKMKSLSGTNLGVVTTGIAGLAAAALAAATAIGTIGFNRIQDLGKEALSLGVSAEALSKLRSVAKGTGTDIGDLSEFIKGLTSSVNDSIGKTTEAGEAMKALGTSAEALQKMTPDQQIEALNKGFAALPNDAEKARVAMMLAGQNGVKMFRMLSMGSKQFHDAMDAAPIVTDDDVSEIRKLQIALDKIKDTLLSIADKFTTYIAPKIEEVANMLLAFGNKLGPLFGVDLKKATPTLPAVPTAAPGGAPGAPAVNTQAQAAQKQAEQAKKQGEALKAQEKVAELQKRANKQAADIAAHPGHTVATPGTNGKYRYKQSNQKDLDRHSATMAELNAAQNRAKTLADEAKTQSQAMADAIRMSNVNKQFADMKGDQRESIQNSGQDEIHRRVNGIKGLSDQQRKQLIQGGYKQREADRTSSLRDELQESTKMPQQKLAEDLDRINRMVKLGAENGGLTRRQGIIAAAQKTQESGIADAPKFAGALSANSIEGRSYLMNQMSQSQDPVAIAKMGLALTGTTNSLLGQILDRVGTMPANNVFSM